MSLYDTTWRNKLRMFFFFLPSSLWCQDIQGEICLELNNCSQESWYRLSRHCAAKRNLVCRSREVVFPLFLVLLCAIKGTFTSFIAQQHEGPGSWRPLLWEMFLLKRNREVIWAFYAKKCKSLLFGENSSAQLPSPPWEVLPFFLYQQKYKILAAPQAPWGWGRRMLLAGSCVQYAVLYAFNT